MSETLSEVVALDMPQRVLSEIKNVACIKTVQKTPKGSVTTLAMSSPDVPGGVVYQTTKETDTERPSYPPQHAGVGELRQPARDGTHRAVRPQTPVRAAKTVFGRHLAEVAWIWESFRLPAKQARAFGNVVKG